MDTHSSYTVIVFLVFVGVFDTRSTALAGLMCFQAFPGSENVGRVADETRPLGLRFYPSVATGVGCTVGVSFRSWQSSCVLRHFCHFLLIKRQPCVMFTCGAFMLLGGRHGSARREGCQSCVFKMTLCASARSAALAVCGWLSVLRLGSERRKWSLRTVKSNTENRRYLSRS